MSLIHSFKYSHPKFHRIHPWSFMQSLLHSLEKNLMHFHMNKKINYHAFCPYIVILTKDKLPCIVFMHISQIKNFIVIQEASQHHCWNVLTRLRPSTYWLSYITKFVISTLEAAIWQQELWELVTTSQAWKSTLQNTSKGVRNVKNLAMFWEPSLKLFITWVLRGHLLSRK